MDNSYCVILTTAGSEEEAERLAEGLVSGQFVACAQLMPIKSVYRWQGEVEKDSEVLLLLKARADLFDEVEAYLLEHHSYDTPEILQVPVARGSDGYLSWITDVSLPGTPS